MSSLKSNATATSTIVIDGVALPVLTEEPKTWLGSSLLSAAQITKGGLQLLVNLSQKMHWLAVAGKGGDERLKHKVIGTVFYEPSTRTSCSFQAAAARLGGSYIHVDGQGNTSTGKKGETLQDTIQCLQCYTDCTILRHPVKGSIGTCVPYLEKPIINAGDGTGEHPTQALLDVYTIYNELYGVKTHANGSSASPLLTQKVVLQSRLIVVLLGDLKHGRTVHSLAKLLCVTQNVLWKDQLILRFCAPNDDIQVPSEIVDFCMSHNEDNRVACEFYVDPVSACQDANVLYVTRIQSERFESEAAYNALKVRKCRRVALLLLFADVFSYEYCSSFVEGIVHCE
jgi:aspartate carbamoyltransferase catalytic subunit